MTDSEIVNLYLSRREEAIEQSKLKYHRGLQNIANNILSSPPDAEEALNDTYFTAMEDNTAPRAAHLFVSLSGPHRPMYFPRHLQKEKQGKAVGRRFGNIGGNGRMPSGPGRHGMQN